MYDEIDFISIKFNDYCNLDCKYCFESKDARNSHKVFNKGKELLELIKTLNIGSTLFINLIGGEVTLYPNEVYNLCKQLKKIERYKDTTVKIGITTNGTNYNFIMNDLIKVLTPEIVQISWDGIHASQVINSNFTDKQLTAIIDKVGSSVYNEDISISIAVTKDNICYLADSIEYALKQGCRKIEYYFIFNDEYNKYYTTNEFKSIFSHQLHKIHNLYHRYDFDLGNFTYLIYDKFIDPDFTYDHKCRFVGKMLVIDPDGDIYPCLLVKEMGLADNYSLLGNLDSGLNKQELNKFSRLYTDIINSNVNNCLKCSHVKYCTECPIASKYNYNKYNKCITRQKIFDIEFDYFNKYITKEELLNPNKKYNLDYYSKRFVADKQNLKK